MGLQKRLRQAAKTNHALQTGHYYQKPDILGKTHSPTPVSAGVLRAKMRLDAHRKAQAKRLANAAPAQVSRQQLRRADMWRAH